MTIQVDKTKKHLPQDWLVMLRQRSGLTQVQLAALLGLKSERMIQNWEGGYSLPKPDRLKKLIELYLSREVFIKGKEQQEAASLWASVKDMYDTNSPNYQVYQIFDEAWFASLQSIQPEKPVEPPKPPEVSPEKAQWVAVKPLPVSPNRFIGRKNELKLLNDLLKRDYLHLVTILGPGGIGKTRLALEVAGQLLPDFRDGIWLVELASISDPDLVTQVVAFAFGLEGEAGKPLLATLIDYLRQKHLLLLLDNCEHLTEACARLTHELLRNCPNLKILATSREILGVNGEVPFQLPSLRVPSAEYLGDTVPSQTLLDTLAQFEVIEFFLERAVIADPKFHLTPENYQSVLQVCRQLDGIPLALELAAARLRVMSIGDIAGRLQDCFKLLTSGSRTVLPRHQTLLASIDWSYALLSEQERHLLNRLAIFSGGWILPAAESICAGNGVEEGEVLSLLAQLVDKSLVVVEESESGKRLRLLETIRQFALEKLVASGEYETLQDRRLQYYLDFAEQAAEAIKGAEQLQWFSRLEAEHDNLRAALEWSIKNTGRDAWYAGTGLRLVYALHWFWYVRGYENEGREWFSRVLTLTRSSEDSYPESFMNHRAAALIGAIVLSWGQHDYKVALDMAQECQRLYTRLGDQKGMALAQGCLGVVLFPQGKLAEALQKLEECLTGLRESGDQWYFAHFSYLQATALLRKGDYGAAQNIYRETLQIFQQLGDKRWQAWTLHMLGQLKLYQGQYNEAAALLEESLALFRYTGDKRGIGWCLQSSGIAAYHREAYAEADRLLRESLLRHARQGSKAGMISTLEWLAALSLAQNEPERAVILAGAAQTARASFVGSIMQTIRDDYEANLKTAQTRLNLADFEAALRRGANLTLEQAVSFAQNLQ